ncbi:MAG: ribosome biogenesis GTP-binding protein YihA/YsxC [Pseudomonadota bacterium]|nr:ribosome biogenesis GTP-binding protein YihA/YsxC [Pseudomonadota bacterium]MEC9392571.1 ribosome biogenesis GTP-binding protein YihA/YsxC [Pseudomonadota bacterium]MEC9459397.1 ribosome biogenesis GTP-binding protein YihA/YsxC [Pseudomonadota bacterium]MEC9481678.1 ribosome biogenesis GTP-binding protein YihA/YsxC [Pseudomonadota bacterium]|tara:strand:- start:378 stop:1019 length:642 start_codon:yes stop_codon:yes gene_type:complete
MNNQKNTENVSSSGEWLFNQKITFTLGVTKMESLPEDSIPEIAFFGRSNVGKSSLLNAITNQNKLAHTSKNPGRTRELNFFSVSKDKKILNIVDMPGYGYAKASKEKIKQWTLLSDDYIKNRNNLRRVFLLIDSRRNIMPIDNEIMDTLDNYAVSYQIVLTKSDKILEVENQSELVLKEVEKRKAIYPKILITSSKSNYGIQEIKQEIAKIIE